MTTLREKDVSLPYLRSQIFPPGLFSVSALVSQSLDFTMVILLPRITLLSLFSSWDNLHLRARRSPHHIYLASPGPAEHAVRPAGSGLQHAAKGCDSGQGGERQRTGRLPGAAHSKMLLWGSTYRWGDLMEIMLLGYSLLI